MFEIYLKLSILQDSIIGIATSYRMDGLGLHPSRGKRFSSLQNCPDQLWCPPSLLFNGYWHSFLRVELPGCDVDHSPLFSAEVKKSGAVTMLALCAFMVLTGTRHHYL
jgi:hypothetical protein